MAKRVWRNENVASDSAFALPYCVVRHKRLPIA